MSQTPMARSFALSVARWRNSMLLVVVMISHQLHALGAGAI
jgi:hypothetical protein